MAEEAVVLRVAGGNAQYVLNHILSIDSLVHFKEAIIVQHTGKQVQPTGRCDD
jgi:hypothetical protein